MIRLIAAAILLLFIAGTGFFVVDQTEDAVVTRFGKYINTVGPGLHFKIPLWIDRSFAVPTKPVQTEQFGFRTVRPGASNVYQNNLTRESTMLTGDLNIVDVEWIIQYRITDPRAWLFNVHRDVRLS
ncbi:MAG TPA: SPFH domain-containing protein, partial [Treponemataceae bacterium]|nr:SPFH domain-containing protein [Treponemataceae bacterium]